MRVLSTLICSVFVVDCSSTSNLTCNEQLPHRTELNNDEVREQYIATMQGKTLEFIRNLCISKQSGICYNYFNNQIKKYLPHLLITTSYHVETSNILQEELIYNTKLPIVFQRFWKMES